MFYQWGSKNPFTFATSSGKWGDNSWNNGMYPVKIYTIDGMLIYQESKGGSNKDKQPVGGIIIPTTSATSMRETINNPIKFYGYWGSNAISSSGHTKDLWDYYWTSYSRGVDGKDGSGSKWHNNYLDGYTSQRSKSIYDPCPYGYRGTANGTFNNFAANLGWTSYSYIGGTVWVFNTKSTWVLGLGNRQSGSFFEIGANGFYYSNIMNSTTQGYMNQFSFSQGQVTTRPNWFTSFGQSVRCIENYNQFK